jgi:DNA polymerase I-like protein with 3'-5' exonuclease and polymerase domains
MKYISKKITGFENILGTIKELKLDLDSCEYGELVALDTETNGLDAYKNKVLLLILTFKGSTWLIDTTTIDVSFLQYYFDKYSFIFITHNGKFDSKMLRINCGLDLKYIYDTMIVDQRIYQGYFTDVKNTITITNEETGRETKKKVSYFSLNAVRKRYLKNYVEINKEIRNAFINRDFDSFIPSLDELDYAAADTLDLETILKAQINKLFEVDERLYRFIFDIEFPLINVLVDCELEGYTINTETAKINSDILEQLLKDCKIDLNDYISSEYSHIDFSNVEKKSVVRREMLSKQLHNFFVRISTQYLIKEELEQKNKTTLKKYQNCLDSITNCENNIIRIKQELENLDVTKINWSSSKQVLKVFDLVGMKDKEMPISKDAKTRQYKPGVGKVALSKWFVDNKTSSYLPLMNKFQTFTGVAHTFRSFCQPWLDKYLRENNKVYTIFRQCNTETGRFQSGDKKSEASNFQQIPNTKKYGKNKTLVSLRKMFVAKQNHKILIADWSSAELRYIIDKASDKELKLISETGDLHSYFAQRAWRAIYNYRYLKTGDPKDKELAETLIVSQNENTHLRGGFKPFTFKLV